MDLKKAREVVRGVGRKSLGVDGIASTKALRQERAWCV